MDDITNALAKMEAIESRLGTLEQNNLRRKKEGPTSNVDKHALAKFQLQMIDRLKEIRSTIMSSGGDVVAIKAERDAALAENAKLKADAAKMEYRINHLVKMLNAEEAKTQQI